MHLGGESKHHSIKPNFEFASARMKQMKRELSSQAPKFYPAIDATFEKTLALIPKKVFQKILEKRGQTVGEFRLDMFSKVLFMPKPWLEEMKQLLGQPSKGVVAMHYDGHFLVPSNGKHTNGTVLFSLMHEMIHGFDAISGIKRNASSIEALAYAAQLFSFGELISVTDARRYAIGEGAGKEYTQGFLYGKEAADAATEIRKRGGSQKAQTFFHRLFEMGNITSQKIEMVKRELFR